MRKIHGAYRATRQVKPRVQKQRKQIVRATKESRPGGKLSFLEFDRPKLKGFK